MITSILVRKRTRDRNKESRDQTAQCIVHCAVSIIQDVLVNGQKTHTRSQERKARPNGAVHRALRRFHYSRLPRYWSENAHEIEIQKDETKRRSASCAAPFPLFKVTSILVRKCTRDHNKEENAHEITIKKGETKRRSASCTAPFPLFKVTSETAQTTHTRSQ